jgi:hypothetical protein
MLNRSKDISLTFGHLVYSLLFGFVICFGLGLLWKWWDISPGLSLTKHEVKDVVYTAIPITIGMTMGEYTRQKWLKRSKSKEELD